MTRQKEVLRNIVWASLLAALSVVFDLAFKVIVPNNIGFAFYAIPIIIAGMFLGVKYSIVIAILGDSVSVLLAGETFLPLFALGSLMWGLIPALLLNKDSDLKRIIFVVLITHLLVTSINSVALAVHIYKRVEGLYLDLPFRLVMMIPSSLVISFLSEALIEPIKIKKELEIN